METRKIGWLKDWIKADLAANTKYSYWLIHRADYRNLLYDAAKEAGANIIFGAAVEYVEEREPSVVLQDGRKIRADIVIGADGMAISWTVTQYASLSITNSSVNRGYRYSLQNQESGGSRKRGERE